MSSLRSEWLWSLIEPIFMLKSAVYHYLKTLLLAIAKGDLPLSGTQWQKIRGTAFSSLWLEFSAPKPPGGPPSLSAGLLPPLLSQATGVVLEVGPGSGSQMSLLKSDMINRVYGAEPCEELHYKLQIQVDHHQMQDKYHILAAGADANALTTELIRGGFIQSWKPGDTVFDTIICVRTLCSMNDANTAVLDLYRLLHPGGKMLICEHVANPWKTAKGSLISRLFQQIYMLLGWAFFIGDCRMNQDTESILTKAVESDGGWKEVNLEMAASYSTFPYLHGSLVKQENRIF
ncbi:hypothetical protein N7462_005242 [Penicillium macrosclerotiorum]|uniref:uncharacterized protein n=1 Tax=Penicillium macrosclerotiorum TaxID=303699 RepID=UPI0025488906|nr:uncharacterized protein N7462_005242 [Penicillium macrosclerotiorum]KAJ5690850.1 hypothetical protein N7462_005242 [Penicillium macrosclerotiorum]